MRDGVATVVLIFLPFLVVAHAASLGLVPEQPEDSPVPLREWALGEARQRFDVWLANKTRFENPFEGKSDEGTNVTGWLSQDTRTCGRDAQAKLTGGVPEMFVEYDIYGARAVDVFNVLVECGSSWGTGAGMARRTSCELLEGKEDLDREMQMQAQGIRGVYSNAKGHVPRESTSWRVASANFTTQEFYYIETSEQNNELLDRHARNPERVEQDMCFYGMRIRAEGDHVHVTQTSLYNPNYNFWLPRSYYRHLGGFVDLVAWVGELQRRSTRQNEKHLNASVTQLPPFMLDLPACTRAAPNTDYREALLSLADEELQRTELVELPPRRLQGLQGAGTLHLSRRLAPCGGRDITAEMTPVWHGNIVLHGVEPAEVFTTIASQLQEMTWNHHLTDIGTFNTDAAWSRGLRSKYSFMGWDQESDFDRTINEWQVARHKSHNNSYLVATRSNLGNMTDYENRLHRMGFGFDVTACNCLSAFEALEGPDPDTTLLRFSMHVNMHSDAENEAIWDMVGPEFIETFTRGVANVASQIHRNRSQATGPDLGLFVDDGVLALLVPPPPNGRNPDATLSELAMVPMDQKEQIFLKLDIPSALNTTLSHDGPKAFLKVSYDMLQIMQWAKEECSFWMGDSDWCRTLTDTFEAGLARDRIQLQQQGWVLAFVQKHLVKSVCAPAPIPEPETPGTSFSVLSAIFAGAAVLVLFAVFLVAQRSRARRRKMQAEVHLVSAGLEEARGAESAGRMFVAGLFGSRGLGFGSTPTASGMLSTTAESSSVIFR